MNSLEHDFSDAPLDPQEVELMRLEEYLDGQLDTDSASLLEGQLKTDHALLTTFNRLQRDRASRRAVFASSFSSTEMDLAVDKLIAATRGEETPSLRIAGSKVTVKSNPYFLGRLRYGSAIAACLTLGVVGGSLWNSSSLPSKGVPGEIIGNVGGNNFGTDFGNISGGSISGVSDGQSINQLNDQPRTVQISGIALIELDAEGHFIDRVQLSNQDELRTYTSSKQLTLSRMPFDGFNPTGQPRELTLIGIRR